MKLGIIIPSENHYIASFRFMKLYKEGIDNVDAKQLASKEEIERSHNAFVKETYKLLETALLESEKEEISLEIQTKDIFKEDEVDKFLGSHAIQLSDRTYFDAGQRFIYFDTEKNILRQY